MQAERLKVGQRIAMQNLTTAIQVNNCIAVIATQFYKSKLYPEMVKLPDHGESGTGQEQGTDAEPATPQSDTKTGAANDHDDRGDELTCRAGAQSNSLPSARIKLISSVKVLPCQSALVDIHARGMLRRAMLEPTRKKMGSLQIGESLLDFTDNGTARLAVTNHGHVTRVLWKGTTLGEAFDINTVDPEYVLGGNPELFTLRSVLTLKSVPVLLPSCEPEDQSSCNSSAPAPATMDVPRKDQN